MLKSVECDIVMGCNLRCPHCTHYAGMQKGYVPLAVFESWLHPLRRHKVPAFYLIGGEPLLHPYFAECICLVHRILNCEVGIYTNGTMVGKKADMLLHLQHTIGLGIVVSYKNYEQLGQPKITFEKIADSCNRFTDRGGKLIWRQSNFTTFYPEDPAESPNSEPEKAYTECGGKECSCALWEGKLHACWANPIRKRLQEAGKLSTSFEMNHYEGLDPAVLSTAELDEKLETKCRRYCRNCIVGRQQLSIPDPKFRLENC